MSTGADTDPSSEHNALPSNVEGETTAASDKEQLEQLVATATANYAQKQYRIAAEAYSRATELQAKMNGEMAPKNADLLYAYGRCLYHVAVLNSEVLGSKLAGEARPAPATSNGKASGSKAPPAASEAPTSESAAVKEAESAKTEQMVEAVVEEKQAAQGESSEQSASKPFFTFTGDEGYDESDEEEEDAGAEGEAEGDGEDDDFSNAFEVLDLARVLFERQIEETKTSANGASGSSAPREVEERLADTYDLQAEISLEGEQFGNAATDLQSALKMKLELYPFESSIVAEAHYKLSLALEFAAVTHHKDANGEIDSSKPAIVDQKKRGEAAEQMEQAIASCKKRIELEEAKLAAGAEEQIEEKGKKGKITRQSIDDVKEMVVDMEQRLTELREAPVTVNDPRGTGAPEGASDLSGILGSVFGETSDEQKRRIEDAMQQATDLTGLVKRKRKAAGDAGTGTETPEKRARTEETESEKGK